MTDAIAEAKKVLDFNPNVADYNNDLGNLLHFARRNEEAVPFFKKAIRLNPYSPSFYYWRLGAAYMVLERYDESIVEYKKR